jgi:hypothetical protein
VDDIGIVVKKKKTTMNQRMTGKDKEDEESKQDNMTAGSREAKLTSLFFSSILCLFFF